MSITPIRRVTRACKMQVWISFAFAAALRGSGLARLPGRDLDRAFMAIGHPFCLTSAIVLAKSAPDREATGDGAPVAADTPLWGMVVRGGFALAMALTGWGLVRMQIEPACRAFLGVGWLDLISAAFTLAKTLRDAHEADRAEGGSARRSACQPQRAAGDAGRVSP